MSKILSKIAPMFSYDDCAFNNLKSKNTTARAVIGREIGLLNWFTLESSFHAFRYFNKKNKCFCLCKYTIEDYHTMGEFLWKGFYGTVKAFFDEDKTGIKHNENTSRNNREMADNSITTNALARKAHAEILDAKPIRPRVSISKQNTIEDHKTIEEDENKLAEIKEDEVLENKDLIDSLAGNYEQKLEEKVNYDLEQGTGITKIIEEDDEEYSEISKSDEDDSESEPSEDNFSDDELDQLHEEIKNRRKEHYDNLCQNFFPDISNPLKSHSISTNSNYLVRDRSKLLREPKKIEVYQFSLTPQNLSQVRQVPKYKVVNFTTPDRQYSKPILKDMSNEFGKRKQSYVEKNLAPYIVDKLNMNDSSFREIRLGVSLIL